MGSEGGSGGCGESWKGVDGEGGRCEEGEEEEEGEMTRERERETGEERGKQEEGGREERRGVNVQMKRDQISRYSS